MSTKRESPPAKWPFPLAGKSKPIPKIKAPAKKKAAPILWYLCVSSGNRAGELAKTVQDAYESMRDETSDDDDAEDCSFYEAKIVKITSGIKLDK